MDLASYNYLLKCFVIVDLKTVKLTHRDIGQMAMYVHVPRLQARRGRQPHHRHHPLCDSKDETVVKYSVMQESQQIFASKCQCILPTEEELIAEIEREKRLIGERGNERPIPTDRTRAQHDRGEVEATGPGRCAAAPRPWRRSAMLAP